MNYVKNKTLWVLTAVGLVVACSVETTPLEERTETRIGTSGGQALSAAGELKLSFSAGTLSGDSVVTISTDRTPTAFPLASPVFDLNVSPAPAATFDPPVELTIAARAEPGARLVVVNLDGPNPVEVPGSVYNEAEGSVAARLAHFSRYGAMMVSGSASRPAPGTGCALNERVSSGACVPCTSGKYNLAGDDPTGADTSCDATESLQERGVEGGQLYAWKGAGLSVNTELAIDLSATTVGSPSTALPAGFIAANYHGAVDPAAATAWWRGWTYAHPSVDGGLPGAAFHPLEAEIKSATVQAAAANGCQTIDANYADGGVVTVFGQAFPVCVVSQPIVADTTWPNSHVFILIGTVNVGTGAASLMGAAPASSPTLTIQAGTQVYGEEGATSLVITRGAKLRAVGTQALPIVMASAAVDLSRTNVITNDPTDLTQRGQWGGVVLSGLGVTNEGDTNGEAVSPDTRSVGDRWYGGADNTDSSGVLEYVVIAEAGFPLSPNVEPDALVLEAAGSGTRIEYVQILGAQDDCFGWLGGAAPGRHLVCNGASDDGLDLDVGNVSAIQFALVVLGDTHGDQGIESDGNADEPSRRPATAPTLANITVLGAAGDRSTAALHRSGSLGSVYRSVYADYGPGAFAQGCLDVDTQLPAGLQYRDVVLNCAAGNLIDDDQ